MQSSPVPPSCPQHQAAAPAPPPPGGSPHVGRGGASSFQRSQIVESGTAMNTNYPRPTAPTAQPQPPNQATAQSTAMTADNIGRAFGRPDSDASSPHHPAQQDRGNGIELVVMPSRKEGSDAVSMYSMSQSVLPADPRERLYYRPRRHLLQCYMLRKKEGGFIKSLLPGSQVTNHFFLEHSNEFVIAARNLFSGKGAAVDQSDGINNGGEQYRVKRGMGNMVFSINRQQLDKDPASFVGKWSQRGMRYVVMFSEGNKRDRKEIAAVILEPHQDNQRRFRVILPAIDESTGIIMPLEGGSVKHLRDGRGGTSILGGSRGTAGSALVLSSSCDDDEAEMEEHSVVEGNQSYPPNGQEGGQKRGKSGSMLVDEYLSNPRSSRIIALQNKAAEWDSVIRGYQLNFHGRATKASEKNFQLVVSGVPDKVVMLFGKQSNDRYAVDFRYPLCGLQAAAIASIMSKLHIIHF